MLFRSGSDWLLDNLSVGDALEASLPVNNFPMDWQASTHTLIAGGIGVTPMMAMGYALQRAGASCQLHFCAPDAERAPFLNEVQTIFGENLQLYFDGGDPSRGVDLRKLLAGQREGEHVYVCGPPGLVAGVREHASHWVPGSVHWEQFVPAQAPAAIANEAFDIVLSRRNLTLPVPSDKTIIQVVREAGVEIESSCEDGLCGCCRVRLLGGAAEHRDLVLTDKERESNQEILICISRAKAGETLVLDI